MISTGRDHSTNVKNWRNGTMALRWRAAGMIEARNQFRRVDGSMHLPALRAALERHVNGSVTEPKYDHKHVMAA
jgi:putative transposase